MALDFKEVFGEDASLTVEQLQQRLQDKGIKLANLASGEYVDAKKYQSAAKELESLKQKQEELKRSQMSEAEKLQADLNEIKAQNQLLTHDRTKSKIESLFAKNGVKPENYEALIENFASLDEQSAIDSAMKVVSTITAQKEAITTQIRQELMQGMKTPQGGSPEVAKKFSDMTMAERVELKKSNPDLYASEAAKARRTF